MLWITTLSTQRLSATIILLRWDFLCELCNSNASTQISTRLFCFFFVFFSPPLLLCLVCSALSLQSAQRSQTSPDRRGGPTVGRRRCRHGNRLNDRQHGCNIRAPMINNMKYKKFITIMQAALGVAPLNKRELIPPPRKLWKPVR